MNTRLLRALWTENGDTMEDYAKVINKSVTTLQDRMKGKKDFLREEMEKTRKHYNLSDERFMSIFFNE